jgi:predicted CopG family antitoxin
MTTHNYRTICVSFETFERLKAHKLIDSESFNDAINRILDIHDGTFGQGVKA